MSLLSLTTGHRQTDMLFLKFAIEYLCKNKKLCETIFATCSHGAQVKSFKQNKMVENLVTLSLYQWCGFGYFQWIQIQI